MIGKTAGKIGMECDPVAEDEKGRGLEIRMLLILVIGAVCLGGLIFARPAGQPSKEYSTAAECLAAEGIEPCRDMLPRITGGDMR